MALFGLGGDVSTRMTRILGIGARLLVVLGVAGCISTQPLETTNKFEKVDGPARLLLLEPDVEVRFVKASEVRETRADWTEAAETNLVAELGRQLADRNIDLTLFSMDSATEREVQLVKLHEAVGNTILAHRFGLEPLPTKRDKFDWSLGPGVHEFAENHDADYALLLFARGEYASAGKVLANIVMAAAIGASGSTGGQVAFASLIDLRTGDIVWFNVATMGAGTDMRELDGAERLVSTLLKSAPL